MDKQLSLLQQMKPLDYGSVLVSTQAKRNPNQFPQPVHLLDVEFVRFLFLSTKNYKNMKLVILML